MDTDRGGSDQDRTDRTDRGEGESGKPTDDKRSRTLAGFQELHLRPSATSVVGEADYRSKAGRVPSEDAKKERGDAKKFKQVYKWKEMRVQNPLRPLCVFA
jgi:hypothetical protein